MKNLSYLLLMLISTFMLTGCEYNDDDVWSKINDHEERLAALEQWQTSINTNITALQTLVGSLQNNDYVTGVTSFDTPAPGGYKITFSKSEEATIWNGTNGEAGESAIAPVIGVKEYPENSGVYYWTLDGKFIEDGGNKMPVTGTGGGTGTGTDGITPQLRINDANNYWEVSYDKGSTWTSLNVKATGPAGETGAAGPQGEQGDAIFAKDGIDLSDPDFVTFTLADGTIITLPKTATNSSLIAFDSYELFTATPTNNEITIVLGIKESDFSAISASITHSDGTVTDTQTRAESTWTVTVTKPTFTSGNVDPGSVKITISGPRTGQTSATVMLTATLFDANGKSHSVSRPVNFTGEDLNEVTVSADQTLEEALSAADLDPAITTLAIKGSIAAADFAYIKGNMSNLEVLDLSGTDLTTIPNRAFRPNNDSKNTTLRKIVLPNTVTEIVEAAFANCSGLTQINLEHVTTIGKWGFENCTGLTEVDLAATETIGEQAFVNCSSLQEVKFGDNLQTILNTAFKGCTSLAAIEIPGSVQTLGRWIFEKCANLGTITLNDGLQNLSASTFYECGVINITIPASVTEIPNYTFSKCKSLETIEILGEVTTLGQGAFNECEKLTKVSCYATNAPTITDTTFDSNYTDIRTLLYPSGSDYSTWEAHFNTSEATL